MMHPARLNHPKLQSFAFRIILNASIFWSEVGPAVDKSSLVGLHFVSAVAGPSDWDHE
jgi:hypothetical protein